jgi:pyruvate kinase
MDRDASQTSSARRGRDRPSAPVASTESASAVAARAASPGSDPLVGDPLVAIEALRDAALALEREHADDIERCDPATRDGARNLLHYLALRRHDLRPLQRQLGRLGLSSLGRMEAHVMASLDAVAQALRALSGAAPGRLAVDPRFDRGDALLVDHAERVFGVAPADRGTRIMVTLPTEAADDPSLLRTLLEGGTDLVRINAAHDDPETWGRMIERLDAAKAATGSTCRVSFDLAGPKLRTGPIEPGDAVLKLRPSRDRLGRNLAPARVTLVPARRGGTSAAGTIPVEPRVLRRVKLDDTFELVDARGRSRRLRVVGSSRDGNPVCETDRTIYLVPGTVLTHCRGRRTLNEGEVGTLPPQPGAITLAPGDRLDLVRGDGPGVERRIALDGVVARPATVTCDVPELFACLRPGHRVLFDDGRIDAIAREVAPDRAVLEIVRCAAGRARLRAEKGINLPDTTVALPALTERDREHLAFAARRADLVCASFVQRREDVEALREALDAHGASAVAIVLKIETSAGFEHLPELLLAAMRHAGGVAVMVARGDLAVEVGFERLAEVQEEMLWLCEAAHVPVIWATQVLDGLARGGVPSRAEVTDAAMSGRAECVMLNKGPYIVETLAFLSDVLVRMRMHQEKKHSMLRALAVSRPDVAARRGAPRARSRA